MVDSRSSWLNVPPVYDTTARGYENSRQKERVAKLVWTYLLAVRGEMSSGGVRGKMFMWHKGTTAENRRKTERNDEISQWDFGRETERNRGVILMCERQVHWSFKKCCSFGEKEDWMIEIDAHFYGHRQGVLSSLRARERKTQLRSI